MKYINPYYRLDQELKKRGWTKGSLIEGERYIYTKGRARTWLGKLSRENKWDANFSPVPEDVTSSAFYPTIDDAINRLIEMVDTYGKPMNLNLPGPRPPPYPILAPGTPSASGERVEPTEKGQDIENGKGLHAHVRLEDIEHSGTMQIVVDIFDKHGALKGDFFPDTQDGRREATTFLRENAFRQTIS